MGISSEKRKKWKSLSEDDIARIIKMALEDRTAFEDIEAQFGLSPNEVVIFMRTHLKSASFTRWRKRISDHGRLKNESKIREDLGVRAERFKSKKQRTDGSIKNRK